MAQVEERDSNRRVLKGLSNPKITDAVMAHLENQRKYSSPELKGALKQCFVPNYKGLEALDAIAADLVKTYGEHIDAILVMGIDIPKYVRPRVKGEPSRFVNLDVLNNYPNGDLRLDITQNFQEIAEKHPIEDTYVSITPRSTDFMEQWKFGQDYLTSPVVVLYSSERFKERIGLK